MSSSYSLFVIMDARNGISVFVQARLKEARHGGRLNRRRTAVAHIAAGAGDSPGVAVEQERTP
jgi:hypothetical protein